VDTALGQKLEGTTVVGVKVVDTALDGNWNGTTVGSQCGGE